MLSDWVEPAAEKSCGQSFQYPCRVELNRKWEEKGKKKDMSMALFLKNKKPLRFFNMQCRT